MFLLVTLLVMVRGIGSLGLVSIMTAGQARGIRTDGGIIPIVLFIFLGFLSFLRTILNSLGSHAE